MADAAAVSLSMMVLALVMLWGRYLLLWPGCAHVIIGPIAPVNFARHFAAAARVSEAGPSFAAPARS